MAFVIISTGAVAGSSPRTIRASRLALVSGLGALLVMSVCIGVGYGIGRTSASVGLAPGFAPGSADDRPADRVLATRVGSLSGRVSQLEGEAAALARRLGLEPDDAARGPDAVAKPAGGPLIPIAAATVAPSAFADVELQVATLEARLAQLSAAAAAEEIELLANPHRLPVEGRGIRIGSAYGVRHDPLTGRLARHTGLDIPAAHGTPILASGGGRVVSAGYKGAYGRTVVIDHGDGLSTLYGHASKLLVRAGDIVMPNQRIALVGSTGRSTGPHLHFEVIRHGQRVEPRQYLARVLAEDARR